MKAKARYVQVSAGGNHTLLLRSDGKALMIGDIWPFRVPRLKRQRAARDLCFIIDFLYEMKRRMKRDEVGLECVLGALGGPPSAGRCGHGRPLRAGLVSA